MDKNPSKSGKHPESCENPDKNSWFFAVGPKCRKIYSI